MGRSPLIKMAARRIAKSAVDWAAFKAKNDQFINKVHQYPAELPKIDFAYYKARLPNPALADQFQKAYESVSVPYPTDKSNMLKDIEADEKAAGELSKAYVAEQQELINDAKLLLSKIDSLPKPEDMTLEMYSYYFPDQAINPAKPTFWPHIPSMQPGHKDNHSI